MAAMRGSSIPADDFGPSASAANDFGGKYLKVLRLGTPKLGHGPPCRMVAIFHSGVDDIDPEMDPELAMALRMSLEEERARQERVSI